LENIILKVVKKSYFAASQLKHNEIHTPGHQLFNNEAILRDLEECDEIGKQLMKEIHEYVEPTSLVSIPATTSGLQSVSSLSPKYVAITCILRAASTAWWVFFDWCLKLNLQCKV